MSCAPHLLAEFSAAQIVELSLTTALASAFSKAAIAWGPPPRSRCSRCRHPAPGGA